jgi:hypothetical protein
MSYISVTNALNNNAATSDITLVGQNFTDIVNGLSDGTKDLNVGDITATSLTVTGDAKTIAWTDYTSSSTVTGFAAGWTGKIHYKKIGKTVFCMFDITGTGEGNEVKFTLPVTAKATPTGPNYFAPGRARDNNVYLTGAEGRIDGGSSFIRFIRSHGEAVNTWTAGNTRVIIGQFFYEAA